MYKNIDEYKDKLTKIEEVIKEFEASGVELSSDDNRLIQHPEQFLGNVYKLYYRCFDRNSLSYKILRVLIGNRDTDLLYPKYEGLDRWYDSDVDREILGSNFTFLGREEYKYTYKLKNPFEYPDKYRNYISSTLSSSYMWIKTSVKNFSCDKPVNRGYTPGKGVVLYKFYTEDLQYFSIINFTACNLDEYSGLNTLSLREVGRRIQPWASELMNFLVEAWIRRKYKEAQRHIQNGINSREFSFSKDIDNLLISNVGEWGDNWREDFQKSMWIECIMDEIMEIISFDTILHNPDRYREFVEGIKWGRLNLECLGYTPQKHPIKAGA
jgi:hypothetical protein